MNLASARDSTLRFIGAVVVGLLLFGFFVWAIGKSPLEVYATIFEGGFASSFAWQNTLLRAAPLVLTGLAVAIPAQAGLMVIGAEGALVLGGLATAALAAHVPGPALLIQALALAVGAAIGGAWLGLTGLLRAKRGLNETICSLLLSYIAIAVFNHLVEGVLRDPASLNKPSTIPINDKLMIGNMPGVDVHWGLAIGVVCALVAQVVLSRTTWGFALRVTGGNQRVARMAGLPVTVLLVAACAAGGAAAGLAGGIEVLAVHGAANASLIVGYGYVGILVAFLARQQPLACVPVAVMLGGIAAAGSLLQRRLDLPDATTLVLQGFLFICILAADALPARMLSLRRKAPAVEGAAKAPVAPAAIAVPVVPEPAAAPIEIVAPPSRHEATAPPPTTLIQPAS
jgi:general nucleoside transport system permease protein